MTERMTPEAAMGEVEKQMAMIIDNWQRDDTPPGLVVELEKLVEMVREEKR